jgi:hypothetical protein
MQGERAHANQGPSAVRRGRQPRLGGQPHAQYPGDRGQGLIGAILFFGAAGYFLDRVLDTEPWLLVAGALVGALLGLVGVYWQVRRRT